MLLPEVVVCIFSLKKLHWERTIQASPDLHWRNQNRLCDVMDSTSSPSSLSRATTTPSWLLLSSDLPTFEPYILLRFLDSDTWDLLIFLSTMFFLFSSKYHLIFFFIYKRYMSQCRDRVRNSEEWMKLEFLFTLTRWNAETLNDECLN